MNVDDVILAFATQSPRVSTPSKLDDAIRPPFASMPSTAFTTLHGELSNVLGQAGISADVPVGGLKLCTTWTDVSILVKSNRR